MSAGHDFAWSLGNRCISEMEMLMPDPDAVARASLRAATRPIIDQSSLDILSTDQYPMSRTSSTANHHCEIQPRYTLFQNVYSPNGHSIDNAQPPEATDSDAVPSGAMMSALDHTNLPDHNRKPRGRPRVKDQFTTAADRRKAQNRLAQRVLRQKKETTIIKLREKVGSLQYVVQAMNDILNQVHQSLEQTALLSAAPGLSQQIALAFEQSTNFAKLATELAEDDHEAESDGIARASLNDMLAENVVSASIDVEQPHGQLEKISKQTLLKNSIRSGRAMSIVTQNLDTVYRQSLNQLSAVSDDLMDDNQALGTFVNTGPMVPYPAKALNTIQYTYSFEETTFARRLHRFSLEVAFHNLADPIANHEYIARTFGFCYTADDRKDLMFRIQALLMRGSNECLENWFVSYLSVGGAGTHFARRTAEGGIMFPPVVSPPIFCGPTTRPKKNNELSDAPNGEWYDAYEVEEYLKTRGIALDGVSPFVTLDPAKVTPPTPSPGFVEPQRVVGGQLRTPTPSPVEMYHQAELSRASNLTPTVTSDPSTSMPTPITPKKFVWPARQAYAFTQSPQTMMPDQAYHASTLATIDVTKLLKRISDGSACMGRAPGYKRSCVDSAVNLSLQEAYWSTTPRSPTACFV